MSASDPSPDLRPDPVPSPGYTLMRRFWRIFRLLALLSIVIAALAVYLVARGDRTIHIHMLIATALGIGFMVLVGTALMTLIFLSSSTGHDDAVAHLHKDDDDQ